jgi:ABC-2 type transport system permease protein
MVAQKVPDWLFLIYRLNPITVAVELFHYGVWLPLHPSGGQPLPDLWYFSGVGMVTSVGILVNGQLVFSSL